jgi:transposase InsO family protein
VRAKYEFIDSEKANYPLVRMFGWMGVSSSGFYEWRERPASATATRRAWLAAQVKIEFEESDGTYGYRRIHIALARRGIHTGLELVRSLMRELDLVACQPRPWRVTTDPDAVPAAIPDLVRRDFTAPAPGVKLVGDITYIHTWEGWLYLATVIDCHTKAVVGWSMADHFKTPLIDAAITMAAGNIKLASGCIFHSDRGSNYTSAAFAQTLKSLDLRGSVGRTGICWDNAMAESFFGTLKNELVYRTSFATRAIARRAIVRYIEIFYNRRRLHSGLGYRTPAEVHAEYLARQIAA